MTEDRHSIEARLMAKVLRGADDACWEWTGATTRKGYGVIGIGPRTSHVSMYAHRLMLMLSGVEIPDGCVVMHSCDNPRCCNPAHLSVGSNKANSDDMCMKGRQARGERSSSAVLTEREVVAIRRSPESLSSLSSRYGVAVSTIAHVRQRRTWKHVA